MKIENDIFNDLWEYTERDKATKTEKKIHNWLNKDNLGNIIVDNNIWWFELTNSYVVMPDYIYYWLKKWVYENYNLTYLFDIPVSKKK